jgi:hypothetical protein
MRFYILAIIGLLAACFFTIFCDRTAATLQFGRPRVAPGDLSNAVVVVHLPSVGGITPPVRVAGRI